VPQRATRSSILTPGGAKQSPVQTVAARWTGTQAPMSAAQSGSCPPRARQEGHPR